MKYYNFNHTNPNDALKRFKFAMDQSKALVVQETERYYRLLKKATDKVRYKSILFENHVTEPKAFEICKAADLLSPHYSTGAYRGGLYPQTKKKTGKSRATKN